MVLFLAGALLTGIVASFLVSLVPFACLLSLAVVGLSVAMGLRGYPLGQIGGAAIGSLVATEVGYGGGMILNALCRPRPNALKRQAAVRRVDEERPTIQAANEPG